MQSISNFFISNFLKFGIKVYPLPRLVLLDDLVLDDLEELDDLLLELLEDLTLPEDLVLRVDLTEPEDLVDLVGELALVDLVEGLVTLVLELVLVGVERLTDLVDLVLLGELVLTPVLLVFLIPVLLVVLTSVLLVLVALAALDNLRVE